MSALFDTFHIVEERLMHTWAAEYDGPIRALPGNIGHWTLETHVSIHPLKRTRDKMNDADRKTCLDEILRMLEGTHFIFKKAYERADETIYYIKPDWDYWRKK